ncbi:unnamed protein product, partial [marine sediment metagenome]
MLDVALYGLEDRVAIVTGSGGGIGNRAAKRGNIYDVTFSLVLYP